MFPGARGGALQNLLGFMPICVAQSPDLREFTRKYHKFGVFSTICARILDESGPKTGEIGAISTPCRTIVTSVNRRTVVRGVLS